MARERNPSGISSGGARASVALLAALLLVAGVVAPVSTAAVDSGDRASAAAAAGIAPTTSTGNDETTTAGNDETTTVANDEPVTVGNDEAVTIRGVVTADGDPVGNDSMRLRAANGSLADENRTDERGRYDLRGEANRSYDLTYRQSVAENISGAATDAGPRDGLPAVYAVGQVNTSNSETSNVSNNVTRDVSLPAASVLNVTVRAENGTRVGNATVRLTHERDGAAAAIAGRTDERGRLTVAGRVGVELVGNVSVAVEAPNASLENRTTVVRVGEGGEVREDHAVVLPLNDTDPPTVAADVRPDPVNVSESVTFDASGSSDESGIEATTWTVAGQPPADGPTFDASFSTPGTYWATVTVTDEAGNRANETVSVTVVDERPPEATLSANATTVLTNESVLFDAGDSTDRETAIAEYQWDFDGDGVVDDNETGPTVSHAYATNGTYDARVTVVDEEGNRANASQQVTVELPPPTANFSVSTTWPGIGDPVTFNASASASPVAIANYTWTFAGEGWTQTVPDRVEYETSFPDSGTYDVTLTVTDDLGRTAERTRTITVPNKQPEADARGESVVFAGSNVALDGSYSTDPDDPFTTEWLQTNGSDVVLSNASATGPTFTAPDASETETLEFELTVTDEHGATDTDRVTVVVVPTSRPSVTLAPGTDETAATNETVTTNETAAINETAATNETVTFVVNRSGQYRWDFDGDGTSEATPDSANVTDATATHRFDAPGEYGVTLVDAAGRRVVRNVTVVAGSSGANSSTANTTAANATGGGGAGGGGGGGGGGAQTGMQTGGGGGGSLQSAGSGGTGDDGENDDGNAPDDESDAGDDATDGKTADAASADAKSASSATVTVERDEDDRNRVLASITNVSAGELATVRFPDGFGGNAAAFESVAVTADSGSNLSLSAAATADRPADAPRPDGGRVLAYLDVEEPDAAVTSAHFRFRVAVERLAEAGVSPDAVRLYRYHGDEWQTLATDFVGERNGSYRFRTVSPGFSVFAIGVEDGGDSAGDDSGTDDGATGDDGASDSAGPSDQRNDTLVIGLFIAALIGAALWGYVLS